MGNWVSNIKKMEGTRHSDANKGNAVIYGLNGNKVAEGNAANVQQRLKSLPKGLYIVRNGQRSWTVRN